MNMEQMTQPTANEAPPKVPNVPMQAAPAVSAQASAPTQPAAQPAGQPMEEKKMSGWMKWLMIIIAVLIVFGGLGYWIFI